MTTTVSRRTFARVLGASTVYAALRPAVSLSSEALGWVSDSTSSVVRLSSNENPYGPSPLALKAMSDAFNLVWRYPDEHEQPLFEALAKLHNVGHENILLGNGSGEILKLAAAALTGPDKRLVVGNPTFEAILGHSRTANAEVIKVDLTPDYAHDLPRMLGVAGGAGLIYICNPNNPTASLTPAKQLGAFLAKVAAQTIILVDEAYHHYVDSPDYESLIPLVKTMPNLVVTRTFSKIYGMAGVRCGYCIAQPALIQRMRSQQTWDSINLMALVAAAASLKDSEQVDQGGRRNKKTKQWVYAELDRLGYKFIPSHANFLMIDLRRPVGPIIAALRGRRIEVGRVFPPLPNFMRVTIGKPEHMEAFVSAFRAVIS